MSPEAGEGLSKQEDRCAGYDVVDSGGSKVGTAGGVYVEEENGHEYVEVKGGLMERALGTGHYLIPMELCTIDGDGENVRASVDEDTIKNSPFADSALDVSRAFATQVREYYGL
jgi:hypothetical protein